jgi:hypothetical protein
LAWYLEEFFLWPTGIFKERAEKAVNNLPVWGERLYNAALTHESVREVVASWNAGNPTAERRFTVLVESGLPICVLLVSPRSEDKSAGYIDHRVSALLLEEEGEGNLK